MNFFIFIILILGFTACEQSTLSPQSVLHSADRGGEDAGGGAEDGGDPDVNTSDGNSEDSAGSAGSYTDTDGDTYYAEIDDCDDNNPNIHPGAREIINNGKDDDCSNGDEVGLDADDDGYVVSNDCDDTNSAVNPAATEVCDAVDNDCNGLTDDDDSGLNDPAEVEVYYPDSDSDTYGSASGDVIRCEAPIGYVTSNTDCDDGNDAIHPGATDIESNGTDEDCNGSDATPTRTDADGDGYYAEVDDCDDGNAGLNPGANEVCDSVDNNCNGAVDGRDSTLNDPTNTETYYADGDGDGFGTPAVSVIACSMPSGYTTDNTDCHDALAGVNPSATETEFNGMDEDCDGFDFGPTTLFVRSTGSNTLDSGPNRACAPSTPCQTIEHTIAVAASGSVIALYGETFTPTSTLLIRNGLTLIGGFGENTAGSVVHIPSTATTTISLTAGFSLAARDTLADTVTLKSLTLEGNAYNSGVGRYLVAFINSTAIVDSVDVTLTDGFSEGNGISFSATTALTVPVTFTLQDSTVNTGNTSGATTSSSGVYAVNGSSQTVTADINGNTILIPDSSGTTSTVQGISLSGITASASVTANTVRIAGNERATGISFLNGNNTTVSRNRILLDNVSVNSTGLMAVDSDPSHTVTARDNMILTRATAGTGTGIFIRKSGSVLLNNTIIQDGGTRARNIHLNGSDLYPTGMSAEIVNNLFYVASVANPLNIYVEGSIGSGAQVDFSRVSGNLFHSDLGSYIYWGTDSDAEYGSECSDGIDNDLDGLLDSSDSDCTEGSCDDSLDNDGDGALDCSDSDCSADGCCTGFGICMPRILPRLSYSVGTFQSVMGSYASSCRDNLTGDPMFATPLTDFPYLDSSTSPAEDTGVVHSLVTATDLDAFGNDRVTGPKIDIGAEEIQP